MQRVLIGAGTPLTSALSDTGNFKQKLSYAQASQGLKPCQEVILISPPLRKTRSDAFTKYDAALVKAVCNAAQHVILVSSIDVYPMKGLPLDEDCNIVHPRNDGDTGRSALLHAAYETTIRDAARSSTIIRLPEVFGAGFRNGLVSCLRAQHASTINRVAIHQWYPVHRLPYDLAISRYLDVPVVNLCSEPIPMGAILEAFFPGETGVVSTPAPYSRIKSRFAETFGGANGYIMSAKCVLQEMKHHVRKSKRSSVPQKRRPSWRQFSTTGQPQAQAAAFPLEARLHR